ncbi:MAG: MMPL family transporter [Gluconacetobacter diazotrophicus]|nr:MMPL family transporter [Gluconacetobacter diazotrophicus]
MAAGVLVLVAAGLSRISFNVEILKLLPANLRQVQGLSLLLREFVADDELVITVEAPTAEAAATDADAIAAALSSRSDLARHAYARPPWEGNPAQLAELLAFLALNQPPEQVRALVDRLSPEHAPQTLRDTLDKLSGSMSPQEIGLLSYDPYDLTGSAVGSLMGAGDEQNKFASADGTFHIVLVEAAAKPANYHESIAWVEAVKSATAPWQGRDGCRLGYTGSPAIEASISSSMQSDMQSSAAVTLVIIAGLFWFCYRRFRPLLALQAMLLLVFGLSLAIAGLFMSQLTVIGVGSSAIMIGLSVDYGYFVYQRAQGFGGTVRELQRQCLRYIAWTAGTTGAAFFALNVSSLPGLSQLGNLVGTGVVVGAVVMLTVYAPLVLRWTQREGARPPSFVERLALSARFHRAGGWITAGLVAVLLGVLLWKGAPATDFSDKPLRPRHSEAYDALDHMAARLSDQVDPLNLLVEGDSVDAVLVRLRDAEAQLAAARGRGDVRSFRSALPLWPDAARQRVNLPLLAGLADQAPRLRQTMAEAGFKDEAFTLTDNLLRQWAAWAGQTPPIWPRNDASRWLLGRVAHHDPANGRWYAAGFVQPTPGREDALSGEIGGEGIYLTGWTLLSVELRGAIPREFERAIVGAAVVVLGLLVFAFRDARSVGLFMAATALVYACLLGAMSLLGLTWNFFNLAAILLLLGTGTDYSILLLLSLRRNGGDVPGARRELAVVIALCACSASAGFGSISWANHLGLASLGQTCALGLLLDAGISIFLLPPAWRWLHRAEPQGG